MINLLDETKEVLKENGKYLKDIVWFGCRQSRMTGKLSESLDFEYDNGFGGEVISTDFILVGKDFWLERHAYDGSEWWEFKSIPVEPSNVIKGGKVSVAKYGWADNLEDLNKR